MGRVRETVLYLDNSQDYFGRRLLNGFVQESKKRGWWDTLVLGYDGVVDGDMSGLFGRMDGFVTRGVSDELVGWIEGRGMAHLVLRSTVSSEDTTAPHVDDAEVGRIAAGEIGSLGLANQAFLGFSGVAWSEARGGVFTGCFPGCAEFLISPRELSSAGCLLRIAEWVRGFPKPVGIFAASDDLAVAAIHACHLEGIQIPEEVAIIGADNHLNLCDHALVSLSSIELHAEVIGRRCAWEMAWKMGKIDDLEKSPILRPPELVIRESSHQVTKHFVVYNFALSWINRHALTGPSVDELADACGVSRRSLERVFGKISGVSPAALIREKRLNGILHLLLRDSISLGKLAQQANFSDQASFSNFVRRNMGESPKEVRFRAGIGD